ncbi:uncharacterized protein TNCV_3267061 [Trichonephila clavipes]|nr:uncharacterized protein TNCV_3267061 [Trichonephila clavipes]
MIANYVNEQHDTWDQFLREFAYAIRTAVNESTEKTPAELFLGRKLITPFQKLVMVSDGMIWKAGKRLTINVDQVRTYRHRKCDETEIGTGSPDNGSLRDDSNGFDRVQRRSNESQDGLEEEEKESRTTIERKTQQGGPVRSRNGRGRNHNPYIEERTRSSNRNARREGDQQRQDQERSLYEKVTILRSPGRKRQLQVIKKPGCIVSFYILSNKWSEELLQ